MEQIDIFSDPQLIQNTEQREIARIKERRYVADFLRSFPFVKLVQLVDLFLEMGNRICYPILKVGFHRT